jgi:hypothetical protein
MILLGLPTNNTCSLVYQTSFSYTYNKRRTTQRPLCKETEPDLLLRLGPTPKLIQNKSPSCLASIYEA